MERAQKKVESRNFDIRKTLIKFDDVMNDQRQVIFSQRLKILKETDINNILEGFFEEILGILSTSFKNYKKSNDDQFLKEIKNVTGNSLDDKELNKLSSRDEENFRKSVKNLFFNKQKSRIEILGKEQNKDFEKSLFANN